MCTEECVRGISMLAVVIRLSFIVWPMRKLKVKSLLSV